jgi:hypothetical protein
LTKLSPLQLNPNNVDFGLGSLPGKRNKYLRREAGYEVARKEIHEIESEFHLGGNNGE